MANNAKTRAKKIANTEKKSNWLSKFRRDIDKIRSTGDTPNHYVGGGQAYTRGKTDG